MGWWSTDEEGNSFTGDGTLMSGDGPADVMGAAVDAIVAEYRRAFGRPPTRTEIMATLRFVLGGSGLAD